MTDPKISLAVIDKDPIFALGLCSLIEKRPDVRAIAYGPAEVLDPATPGQVDIAVLDPGQFDLAPLALAQALGRRFGTCAIIGYTAEAPIQLARACLAAGFAGMLPRAAGLDPLLAAITAVHGGAVCIHPSFARLFETAPLVRPAFRARELTEREIYVLKSVAFGKSLKEIGLELDLSSKTIETYKARGSSKLNLQGRRAIVEYAIRNGWVQGEGQSA